MKIRMYEQVDHGVNYFHYSWLIDGIGYRLKTDMAQLGWKWISGPGKQPGCYVTNDKEFAAAMAERCNVVIQSNGTHASISAPGMLISMPHYVEEGVK